MRGLGLRYRNGKDALQGVNIDVGAGEFVVVLGGNGCGKTTLMRCITRALTATSGNVLLEGLDLASLSGAHLLEARSRIGMIWQQPSLVGRRSVIDNVVCGALSRHNTIWTNLGGLPASELPDALSCLGDVGMKPFASQRAGSLSGGQAQRVSIARALLQHPSVLLADEPVASLDPEAAHEIMVLLQRLAHRQKLAVLCVLHQVDLAFAFADRIIGMRDGRIAFDRPRIGMVVTDVQQLYGVAA